MLILTCAGAASVSPPPGALTYDPEVVELPGEILTGYRISCSREDNLAIKWDWLNLPAGRVLLDRRKPQFFRLLLRVLL